MTITPLTSPNLPVPHGFFTRQGGVSSDGYASLNCSLSGGDDRASVLENRARVAGFFDRSPDALLGLKQVHSARVITVTEPWRVGTGTEADAMVTDRAGLLLGVITADCAPVLFADPQARVVGAAHAGWAGAAGGILEQTVMAMRDLGAQNARIIAVVGPCIQQESYEVGEDMRDKVLAQDKNAVHFFATAKRIGHFQFDLPGYCVARLAASSVQAFTITADTLSDATRFFSHRRRTLAGGGVIGHQISVIGL